MDFWSIVSNAIRDIGLSWFTYLSQSLIFGVLMVVATVYIYDHGLKPGIIRIINLVKGYSHYRYLLAFYLYTYLMAIKTIFSRQAEWCG